MHNAILIGTAIPQISYTYTAFVSSGAVASGELNNISKPYSNMDDAANALLTAYPGSTPISGDPSGAVRIALLTNISGSLSAGLTDNLGLRGVLIESVGGVHTLNQILLNHNNDGGASSIILKNITVQTMQLTNSDDTLHFEAPYIYGITGVTIQNLIGNGSNGSNGADGAYGGTSTGADASQDPPMSSCPPQNGANGEGANADGGDGLGAGNGGWGYNIHLMGNGTVSYVELKGGTGGAGGNGGSGGTAIGGAGQPGGSSNCEYDQDGGIGGNGGSASANAGNGGNGGTGGDGGSVMYEAGWTITTYDLSNGEGGGAGGAGASGSVFPGGGNVGGSGSGTGSTGATGADGTGSANSGLPGNNGGNGSPGNLVPI